MQAILRDLGIEEFIEEDSIPPVAKTPPTEADISLQKEWKTGDAKAQTRIELAIGDAEMIHISYYDFKLYQAKACTRVWY